MEHVMLDLETLGTVPGCSILSIGAVEFCPKTHELGEEFYEVVSRVSCKEAGLFEQADTLAWWTRQSAEARSVLDLASSGRCLELGDALAGLDRFMKRRTNRRVWGNGADFDNPLLAVAHHKVGLKQCWPSYNGRCYRTVKNLAPHIKMERGGTHHNALDDAKSQARHLLSIVRQTTLTLA